MTTKEIYRDLSGWTEVKRLNNSNVFKWVPSLHWQHSHSLYVFQCEHVQTLEVCWALEGSCMWETRAAGFLCQTPPPHQHRLFPSACLLFTVKSWAVDKWRESPPQAQQSRCEINRAFLREQRLLGEITNEWEEPEEDDCESVRHPALFSPWQRANQSSSPPPPVSGVTFSFYDAGSCRCSTGILASWCRIKTRTWVLNELHI